MQSGGGVKGQGRAGRSLGPLWGPPVFPTPFSHLTNGPGDEGVTTATASDLLSPARFSPTYTHINIQCMLHSGANGKSSVFVRLFKGLIKERYKES